MNKFLLCALASALLILPGCVKTKTELTVNADNTATIKTTASVKTVAVESMRAFSEANGSGDVTGLDRLLDRADEAKVARELKETGVEITSSKSTSEGGWKGGAVEGKIADVNEWVKKSASRSEKGNDRGPHGSLSELTPRFLKTGKEGVGSMVIMKPDFGGLPIEPEMLDDMGPEEQEMIQAQIDMLGEMFSLPEMSMEVVVTLPGKVLETKGCKKTGENKVAFTLKGADIHVAGLKTFFALKDGVSATFEIPEGCKIRFEDPDAKPEPKPAKDAEGEEKGKGGLRIR